MQGQTITKDPSGDVRTIDAINNEATANLSERNIECLQASFQRPKDHNQGKYPKTSKNQKTNNTNEKTQNTRTLKEQEEKIS